MNCEETLLKFYNYLWASSLVMMVFQTYSVWRSVPTLEQRARVKI